MKYPVSFRGKEYEVHAHGVVPLGQGLVDEYISEYLKRGQFYEEPLLSYLKDKFGTLDFVIDCGANVGNHSKFFSDVMGAKVWAFEPSKENFRLLEKNNPGVTNYNVALGAKSGTAGIEEVPHNMGMNRLVPGKGVVVKSLDSYAANVSPDLIKIDVEGMEDEVAAGAIETIKRCRPVLVVEHNDMQSLYRFNRVIDGLGYKIEVFSVETWEMFIYLP